MMNVLNKVRKLKIVILCLAWIFVICSVVYGVSEQNAMMCGLGVAGGFMAFLFGGLPPIPRPKR